MIWRWPLSPVLLPVVSFDPLCDQNLPHITSPYTIARKKQHNQIMCAPPPVGLQYTHLHQYIIPCSITSLAVSRDHSYLTRSQVVNNYWQPPPPHLYDMSLDAITPDMQVTALLAVTWLCCWRGKGTYMLNVTRLCWDHPYYFAVCKCRKIFWNMLDPNKKIGNKGHYPMGERKNIDWWILARILAYV